MPHPVIALVLSMTSTLGAAPSTGLSVRYEPARSPQAEQARELLKDSDVLKTRIRLPEPVKVVARDCDSPTATWDRAEREITICYSLVDKVRRTMDGISETEEADAEVAATRTAGALAALFHHELGHALTTLNGMSDSDPQADEFAALTLPIDAPGSVVPAAEARHLLAAGHAGIDHLSGIAESATFACLLYGADPTRYDRIARGGWIPAERVPTCVNDYSRVKSAIGSKAVKVTT